MFPSIGCRLLSQCIGALYPCYASTKAIRDVNSTALDFWVRYWVVFTLYNVFMVFSDLFFFWFPFYEEIKVLFLIWMVLPQTKGSEILFWHFVYPYFEANESEIEAALVRFQKQAKSHATRISQQLFQESQKWLVYAAVKAQEQLLNLNKPTGIIDSDDDQEESLNHTTFTTAKSSRKRIDVTKEVIQKENEENIRRVQNRAMKRSANRKQPNVPL